MHATSSPGAALTAADARAVAWSCDWGGYGRDPEQHPEAIDLADRARGRTIAEMDNGVSYPGQAWLAVTEIRWRRTRYLAECQTGNEQRRFLFREEDEALAWWNAMIAVFDEDHGRLSWFHHIEDPALKGFSLHDSGALLVRVDYERHGERHMAEFSREVDLSWAMREYIIDGEVQYPTTTRQERAEMVLAYILSQRPELPVDVSPLLVKLLNLHLGDPVRAMSLARAAG